MSLYIATEVQGGAETIRRLNKCMYTPRHPLTNYKLCIKISLSLNKNSFLYPYNTHAAYWCHVSRLADIRKFAYVIHIPLEERINMCVCKFFILCPCGPRCLTFDTLWY